MVDRGTANGFVRSVVVTHQHKASLHVSDFIYNFFTYNVFKVVLSKNHLKQPSLNIFFIMLTASLAVIAAYRTLLVVCIIFVTAAVFTADCKVATVSLTSFWYLSKDFIELAPGNDLIMSEAVSACLVVSKVFGFITNVCTLVLVA